LIITDGRCRTQSFFEIAGLDQVAFPLGVMTPDTGVTIGLKFHADREGVGFHLRHLSSEAMHLFCDAEEVLHVMTDLVGDNIRLRKVSRRAKTMRHFIEEGKV
jgi:hypothetical protein